METSAFCDFVCVCVCGTYGSGKARLRGGDMKIGSRKGFNEEALWTFPFSALTGPLFLPFHHKVSIVRLPPMIMNTRNSPWHLRTIILPTTLITEGSSIRFFCGAQSSLIWKKIKNSEMIVRQNPSEIPPLQKQFQILLGERNAKAMHVKCLVDWPQNKMRKCFFIVSVCHEFQPKIALTVSPALVCMCVCQ